MMRNTFSTEERLLLLCCSSIPTSREALEFGSITNNNIDWERFIRLSSEFMVAPLVYTRLKDWHSLHPPADVLTALERAYSSSESSHLFFSLELKNLLQLLNKNNIKAIPLKGPLLAETLYDDPCQRVNADLDILLPKESISKAVEILSKGDFSISWI